MDFARLIMSLSPFLFSFLYLCSGFCFPPPYILRSCLRGLLRHLALQQKEMYLYIYTRTSYLRDLVNLINVTVCNPTLYLAE